MLRPPQGPLADSGLPLLHTLTIKGYSLLYPRRLAKCLNRPGSLGGTQARAITDELEERFPSA